MLEKIKTILKSNIKLIIAFVLGIATSGTITYAATILYQANEVSYSTTYSGFSSTNLQGALDELAALDLNGGSGQSYLNLLGTPTNYIFDEENPPTSESPTTPPSGKTVYLAYYADEGLGVCIKRNGTQHCFRNANWIAEKEHIQEVFSGANDRCVVYSNSVLCNASDFNCNVNSNANVNCNDNGTNENCNVNDDGSVNCS